MIDNSSGIDTEGEGGYGGGGRGEDTGHWFLP